MAVTTAAVVGAGAAAYGASQSGKAAEEAAETQAEASGSGIAEQRRQFNKIEQLLSPFVQAATATGEYTPISREELIDTSGGQWRPNQDLYANSPEYKQAWDQFIQGHVDRFGVAPSASAGSNLQVGLSQLEQRFNLGSYNEAQRAAPRETGSLVAQQNILGLRGPEAQRAAIAEFESSPYFQSVARQGETAILQNAAATGGVRGGNVQGALAQFRPSLLNQLIQQRYANLSGLTNVGQASAAQQASAAGTTGTNVANLLGQQGAAVAGGQLAQAGATNQLIGNLAGIAGAYAGAQDGSSGYTGAYGF